MNQELAALGFKLELVEPALHDKLCVEVTFMHGDADDYSTEEFPINTLKDIDVLLGIIDNAPREWGLPQKKLDEPTKVILANILGWDADDLDFMKTESDVREFCGLSVRDVTREGFPAKVDDIKIYYYFSGSKFLVSGPYLEK